MCASGLVDVCTRGPAPAPVRVRVQPVPRRAAAAERTPSPWPRLAAAAAVLLLCPTTAQWSLLRTDRDHHRACVRRRRAYTYTHARVSRRTHAHVDFEFTQKPTHAHTLTRPASFVRTRAGFSRHIAGRILARLSPDAHARHVRSSSSRTPRRTGRHRATVTDIFAGHSAAYSGLRVSHHVLAGAPLPMKSSRSGVRLL